MTTLSSSFQALIAFYYPSKKEQNNYSAFALSHLFFISNSVVFVDKGRKNVFCPRARPATKEGQGANLAATLPPHKVLAYFCRPKRSFAPLPHVKYFCPTTVCFLVAALPREQGLPYLLHCSISM